VYAALFSAQLALMCVGLPVAVAILLCFGHNHGFDVRRLFQAPRRPLLLVVATFIIVLLGPLPAMIGLVRPTSAEGFRWLVDGWIVYVRALLSDLALIGVIWGLFRSTGSSSTDIAAPGQSPPNTLRVLRNPPAGIGFLWDEGSRSDRGGGIPPRA
jgi:hypothetical protein